MAKGKYQRWLTPEGLTLLEGWARDGLTDEEIARGKLKVSPATFYDWVNKFPEISEAIKKGKEVIDYEVEQALLKRALGYETQEKRTEMSIKDGLKTVIIKKQVPGDPTAQIFWLKNRRPEKWRDRRETSTFNEQEQADAVRVFLAAVTPREEDLEALYAEE